MTPEGARDHARAITEAAEAAEQDAFLMDFLQRGGIGLDFNSAGQVLVSFRQWRQRTGKSQGPRNPKDWVMPESSAGSE